MVGKQSWFSERTKHVDIRAHFVRPYVMDEVVTIDLVKSAENTSDIMTKNQQGIYFKATQPKLVYTVEGMEKTEEKCWKYPGPFSNVHFRNTTKNCSTSL